MSRKWEYVTLRDIATDIRDGTHGTHPRVLNGVPFLSAKNIGKNGKLNWGHSDEFVTENEYRLITATFSPMPGDLLITVVGTLGRTTIFNGEKVAFQRSVAFVRPTKEITVDYLFQVSKTSGFSRQMEQRSNATAQAGLYLGELAKIQIPLPGISFQRKIAAILATTDQAIEKTEALIHKYQQIKAGLMHDLFTRGLTTDGKLRLPREQAPELYQETPIGWIPKEWELLKASDICYPVTKGTTPSYFNYSTDEGSVPYLRVENLSFNGSLQFDQDSLFVSKI
ncbi:MAG: restriction endonuclease subunit S, partial [Chloroflexota bacterium]